jgi:hypothetical protein
VRRRRILALVTLALAVVTAIAVAIASSGGGSSRGSPAAAGSTPQKASAPPTTSPGTTTTPATGQPTTPTQTQSTQSTSLRVTLPAGGKLSIGDSGPAVVALQKVLAALSLKVGTPDGNFGPRTQAAVIAFQTAHALNPDGIVGAATAQKLNEAVDNETGEYPAWFWGSASLPEPRRGPCVTVDAGPHFHCGAGSVTVAALPAPPVAYRRVLGEG